MIGKAELFVIKIRRTMLPAAKAPMRKALNPNA